MWNNILGHTREIETLKAFAQSGRVPHALLFSGLKGVGKTTVAVEFCKALNCLDTPGEGCDACRSCVKVMSGTHPDLVKLGTAGTLIKVEEVREVLQGLSLKPFEARYRVVLVEPAEQLGESGSNALLKTLEEPSASTIFILISHKPRLLLPTIRSRVQEIRFTPIDSASAQTGLDPAVLRLTAGTVGGLGTDDMQRIRAMQDTVLAILRGGDPLEPVTKGISAESEAPLWISVIESFLRDLMVLSTGGSDLIHTELEGTLREIRFQQIEPILEALHTLRRGIKQNLNLKIALAELFLMLSRLSARV